MPHMVAAPIAAPDLAIAPAPAFEAIAFAIAGCAAIVLRPIAVP